MNSGSGLTTAFIDLLTGLLMIPFAAAFFRKRTAPGNKQGRLFAMLSAAHIGGFAAHVFAWSQPYYDIFWIIQYGLMYLLLAALADLGFFRLAGRNAGRTAATVFAALLSALFITNAVLNFFMEKDILIFLSAAVVIGIPSVVAVGVRDVRSGGASGALVILSVVPMLIGLPFMFAQTGVVFEAGGIQFDHNGVFHICLLVTLIVFGFAETAVSRKNFRE